MMYQQLRRPIEDRERGAALIMVLGVGALAIALLATMIAFVAAGQRHARQDVSTNGALAAAYAGVEEYSSRITAQWDYVYKGNVSAPFSRTSAAVLRPDRSNPAFGFDGSWATVAGSDGAALFRYEVDASQYDAHGTVRLRSTGMVGQEIRTVIADLRQDGFLRYLYFTDFETLDPWQSGQSSTCSNYQWARPSTCTNINFDNGDVVTGRVHSNDVIVVCTATFNDEVSSAWTQRDSATGMRFKRTGCDSTDRATFNRGDPQWGGPFYRNRLEMPQTNTDIRTDALEWGCVFTGPTRITLTGDGYMQVRSPLTKSTRPLTSTPNPTSCGAVGKNAGQLGHADGARMRVPENGAIYVQNASRPVGDPNYLASQPAYCSNATNSNGVGYPLPNEIVPAAIGTVAAYGCTNGDLFVEGTLNGQVTLAAENYAYVVGDLRYGDPDRDLLGLIGNTVWVHNPAYSCTRVSGRDRCSIDSPDRHIDGAIMALRSFTVQNFTKGGDMNGLLNVRGSIVQRYRGAVAQYSGYIKRYVYDDRLLYRSPPHFLSPMNSNYGVSTWFEVDPAVNADGSWR
ncbi:hypothetical protein [Agrococcus sp. Marseille-Q4369]|uniref:hypothetical protein n=1 Tax=Agrococcus sp. Marseille-Q4369 TaxID=2810513 RepID=UPI001B8B57AB|nr:hypothetical protein [Agrococcus sp. Marseille-Q4369]QUW19664.1 hypothetical protein JSQ78_05040 [Agrococcus sp. Marseille-Q4369]